MSTIIKVLTESVRIATGIPDALPRPGQHTLTGHIEEAIEATGHVIGVAPTGSGKSFSLLAPAMVAAAEQGFRTIISTESLSLMAQIVKKDAPNAAEACEKVTGKKPTFAMLKGFANYVCLATARDTAEAVTDTVGARMSHSELITKLNKIRAKGSTNIDGRSFDKELGIPLLIWALGLTDADIGDNQSYSGNVTRELWDTVSIGPSECVGETCPVFDFCKPRAAKAKAAESDIIITNHSMLAVQAAKGVPVLIGNKTLGEFHMIMVDEAHALPSNVRNAGAGEVSAAVVMSLTRGISKVIDAEEKRVAQLIREGSALAEEINEELAAKAKGTKPGETFRLGENADPLENTGEMMIGWAKSVKNALEPPAKSSNMKIRLKAKRLEGRLDQFIATINQVKLHRTGTARWVEEKKPAQSARSQTPYWAACSSPVNIGGLLRANLWNAPVMADEEDEMVQAMREAGEPIEPGEVETYPLTVVAVSATMPARFGYQSGLEAPNVEYPSPFDIAYGASVLHIPKLGEADIAELFPGWRPKSYKPKFDTFLHQGWAAKKSVSLVEANGGSALVLAATSRAGKAYAAALTKAARGRWNVFSQWDGMSTGKLVEAWRADVTSVLVGTKSMMTGVDAPGQTCRLVIIDRMPRAAGNPVDDARVEELMASMATDKWSADRFVYVQDAALLAEQAAGRLIRAIKDVGMVAILDPRMLKTGPVSYPEPTRLIYKKAVERFTSVTTDPIIAEAFLSKISTTGEIFKAA